MGMMGRVTNIWAQRWLPRINTGKFPILFKFLQIRGKSYPGSLYSLGGRTSYSNISRSLLAARFAFRLLQSLWKLTGTSAAALPRCPSNFRVLRPTSNHAVSRFDGKASVRWVNRGTELSGYIQPIRIGYLIQNWIANKNKFNPIMVSTWWIARDSIIQ